MGNGSRKGRVQNLTELISALPGSYEKCQGYKILSAGVCSLTWELFCFEIPYGFCSKVTFPSENFWNRRSLKFCYCGKHCKHTTSWNFSLEHRFKAKKQQQQLFWSNGHFFLTFKSSSTQERRVYFNSSCKKHRCHPSLFGLKIVLNGFFLQNILKSRQNRLEFGESCENMCKESLF